MRTVYELQGGLGVRGFYLLVTGVVVLVLLALRVFERHGSPVLARLLAWVVLLVALGAVLFATLRPYAPPGSVEARLVLDPVRGIEGWAGSIAWRPVVNNVGLFVPLGAMMAAAMPRLPRGAVWLLLVALSVSVEAAQYLVPSGRVANSADVLANGLGAAVGLALYALVAPRGRRPSPDAAVGPPPRRSVAPRA